MNGTEKFHKPNGPAFAEGEKWFDSTRRDVTIQGVTKFGDGKFDYEVSYIDAEGNEMSKDAWNFQVRYTHQADLML